jgi:dephospho-CoA kinase
VKEYVLEQLDKERQNGRLSWLFLEAALLIEEHYDAICDELWYIYTSEENRSARLLASRGYSDGKIDGIFKSQLSEAEYRTHCRVVIDNNGTPEQTFEQIDKFLRRSADEYCIWVGHWYTQCSRNGGLQDRGRRLCRCRAVYAPA